MQNAAGKRRQIARAAPIRAACGTPLAELPEHGSSNAVTRYSRYSRSDAAPDIAVTRYSRYSRFSAAPGNVVTRYSRYNRFGAAPGKAVTWYSHYRRYRSAVTGPSADLRSEIDRSYRNAVIRFRR